MTSWVAVIGIGLSAMGYIKSENIKTGQPEVLTHGMDYLGNICGEVTNRATKYNENMEDKPKAYTLPSGLRICVEACPEEDNLRKFYCKYEVEAFINDQVATVQSKQGNNAANSTRQSLYLYYTSTEECMPHLQSTSFLGYCVPSVLASNIESALKAEYEGHNITTDTDFTISKDSITEGGFFDGSMADVYTVRYVIFAFGIGVALIVGLIYCTLLRVPGWCIYSHMF